eukprot:TRINITY_DN24155_c0_g1_i1.p2 TRINITY_DN24155_c0_g1~~TRINITY_DN24155_c0_g1_i1.p2  ORF type:complete len:117 (+),score=0.23 TRINITY_DN24155_c0_g1_i1:718-1068(+)
MPSRALRNASPATCSLLLPHQWFLLCSCWRGTSIAPNGETTRADRKVTRQILSANNPSRHTLLHKDTALRTPLLRQAEFELALHCLAFHANRLKPPHLQAEVALHFIPSLQCHYSY